MGEVTRARCGSLDRVTASSLGVDRVLQVVWHSVVDQGRRRLQARLPADQQDQLCYSWSAMPRVVVNVSEAKAKLSKLIDMVYHGV